MQEVLYRPRREKVLPKKPPPRGRIVAPKANKPLPFVREPTKQVALREDPFVLLRRKALADEAKRQMWKMTAVAVGKLFLWGEKQTKELIQDRGISLDSEPNFWDAIDSVDIEQEVEAVKKELVDLIIAHLKESKIDVTKARELANAFLGVLPIRDQLDLLAKLKNLGEKYDEAKEIYVKELNKVETDKRDVALNEMRDAIRLGNMDQAIFVAKAMQQGGQT